MKAINRIEASLIRIDFFNFTQVLNKLLIIRNSFVNLQGAVHYIQCLTKLKLVDEGIGLCFHTLGIIGWLHFIVVFRFLLILIFLLVFQPTAEQLIIVTCVFIVWVFQQGRFEGFQCLLVFLFTSLYYSHLI